MGRALPAPGCGESGREPARAEPALERAGAGPRRRSGAALLRAGEQQLLAGVPGCAGRELLDLVVVLPVGEALGGVGGLGAVVHFALPSVVPVIFVFLPCVLVFSCSVFVLSIIFIPLSLFFFLPLALIFLLSLSTFILFPCPFFLPPFLCLFLFIASPYSSLLLFFLLLPLVDGLGLFSPSCCSLCPLPHFLWLDLGQKTGKSGKKLLLPLGISIFFSSFYPCLLLHPPLCLCQGCWSSAHRRARGTRCPEVAGLGSGGGLEGWWVAGLACKGL